LFTFFRQSFEAAQFIKIEWCKFYFGRNLSQQINLIMKSKDFL
jgi:hypothetical protein